MSEPKKKHAGGRPKIEWETITATYPNWREIIEGNYSKGRTDERIRRDLRMGEASMMSSDLFDRLMAEIPEFSQSIKEGRELSKLWWLEVGQDSMWDEDFSPSLWFMNMKNRHAWRDKQSDEVAKVFNVSSNQVTVASTPEENLKLIQAAKKIKAETK